MRLIKILGLAAVAAMAAMAFIGATSASAADTQLCNTHTALTCSSGATSVSMENVGVGTLLNDLKDVLCLNAEATATPLGLGNPQSVHVLELKFTECGTNTAHTNCEITVTELPLTNVSKTGLDTGTLTATNGRTFVFCENVLLDIDIECEYDATGLQFAVGAQHLTANETQVDEVGSTLLCPNNPTVDGLLVTTANAYVLA